VDETEAGNNMNVKVSVVTVTGATDPPPKEVSMNLQARKLLMPRQIIIQEENTYKKILFLKPGY
jgi:hypothetical protein